MQNFVGIFVFEFELLQRKIAINFELQKNC